MINFKNALAASALLSLTVAAPAMAQDSSFSGFYVGGNVGWLWGDTKSGVDITSASGATVIPPQDLAALRAANTAIGGDDNGFAGGFQTGYNWVSGPLMLGFESGMTFTDVSKSATATVRSPLLISPPVDYTLTQEVEANQMYTFRPRIGYVSGPWLFFGSAGVAVTELKYKVDFRDNRVPANIAQAEKKDTKTGFAGSLGMGYALDDNWSVTGEWLYANFGKVHADVATPNGYAKVESHGEVDLNTLRVGVNYRF